MRTRQLRASLVFYKFKIIFERFSVRCPPKCDIFEYNFLALTVQHVSHKRGCRPCDATSFPPILMVKAQILEPNELFWGMFPANDKISPLHIFFAQNTECLLASLARRKDYRCFTKKYAWLVLLSYQPKKLSLVNTITDWPMNSTII